MKFHHILIFIGISSASMPAFAQTNWQWAKSAGGKGNDQAYSIAADSSGNVYVAGVYADSARFSGTTIHAARKGNSFFLAKYSSAGSLIWVKTSTVKGASYATGVCIAQNKYLYLTGSFNDSLNFGTTVFASNSLFLAKYDLDGNVIWAKSEDAAGGYVNVSVSSDAAGNAYICGSFSGAANFDGTHLTGGGKTDIFLGKFDPNGALKWAKQFGTATEDLALEDVAFSIAAVADGDFAVTGSFGGTIDFGTTKLTAQGRSDIFIAKFSTDGIPVWAQQSGDTSGGSGLGITMDANEDVFVTGQFGGYTPEGCEGSGNIYIAKYSTDGVRQWVKCSGSGGEEFGYAIAADKRGNIFVTGQYDFTIDLGTGPLPWGGITDMFIAQYNSSGTILWADRAGSVGLDFGTGVALDSSSDVYLAGGFADTISFGPFITESVRLTDMYIAKIGFPLGVLQENNSSQLLTLYPNPAHTELHVEINSQHAGEGYVEIFSLLGGQVKKIAIPNSGSLNSISISLTGLPPGVYLCRYSSGESYNSSIFVIAD